MTSKLVPDSEYTGIIALLPVKLRALALLARLDRPIGWWLLFWPCVFGLALSGGLFPRWDLALWMLLGAIVMRGAGCVYNDIIDRDLDAQVARTASRPLPSGDIGVQGAWAFLLGLCALGLLVLVQLRWEAQVVALGSILLVAAYPFMKRITWWPHLWLGLVLAACQPAVTPGSEAVASPGVASTSPVTVVATMGPPPSPPPSGQYRPRRVRPGVSPRSAAANSHGDWPSGPSCRPPP